MEGLNQSIITTYTVAATVAGATPIQVKGRCLFQFDGTLQIALERNAVATQQFTLISAVGTTDPIMMDFGSFGRTIYCYFPAGIGQLSMWLNTAGVN